MKAIQNSRKLFAEGQSLEQSGQSEDAAAAYQQAVDADPQNQEAVGRLLVLYRRMKDYRKELTVIQAALNAIEQRGKAAQEKWISSHPGAAKAGRQVLRSLGSETTSTYGADTVAGKLLKRKEFVEKKLGKTSAKKKKKGIIRPLPKKTGPKEEVVNKKAPKPQKQKKKIPAKTPQKATENKKHPRQKAAKKPKKPAETPQAAKKSNVNPKHVEKPSKTPPSLFVVSLRYLVPLEQIDAAMKKHVAFLKKHQKDFVMSGRQVPRAGGIILARGKNREAVERIMKQDPFVKTKLATADIVEFVPNIF